MVIKSHARHRDKSMSSTPQHSGAPLGSTRDRLLKRISSNTDLPAIGAAVARVVRLASSDDEAPRELAHFILSDVALTQKILRLANSISYRKASDRAITTISKAIFALGFDTVKSTALAMLLVDGIGGDAGESLRTELGNAVRASIIGRELAKRTHINDVEEVAINALFKNIGRVLVAAHDHDAYVAIADLCADGKHTIVEAAVNVLNCSFETLGDIVLREWRMPESLIQAIAPIPPGVAKPSRSRRELLQQTSTFSAALAPAFGSDIAAKALIARFGSALNIDAEDLRAICANADAEFAMLGDTTLPPAPDPSHVPAHIIPSELLMMAPHPVGAAQDQTRHPSGKPMIARSLLLAALSDVTEMRSSGRCNANELLTHVLEALYHSLGFSFAALFLRTAANNQYRARVTLGENSIRYQSACEFSPNGTRDVFQLSLDNDTDLFIADANQAKSRALLPDWHRQALSHARSIMLLPLVVNKRPFGLFYADRTTTAPEGIAPEESALITALKSQVLAALGAR